MPYLSPPTLTTDEQKLILRVTAKHPRDHAIISMAFGTGLRVSELIGLNVGDVFTPDGTPWAHLDIAGPAFNEGTSYGYTPKGGTGAAVRTLVRLAEDAAAGGLGGR